MRTRHASFRSSSSASSRANFRSIELPSSIHSSRSTRPFRPAPPVGQSSRSCRFEKTSGARRAVMNVAARELDFPLNHVAELGDELLGRIDAMRALDPIIWSEQNQVWMVTGHAEVMEGFAGTLPLSNRRLPDTAVALIPPE